MSHCVAKGVRTPEGIPHICYCYTPMRYAWIMKDEYLKNYNIIKKYIGKLILNYLRIWDKKTSSGVTHFIAISEVVRQRIKECYNRESYIIYPPVDCQRFQLSENDNGYYLVLSALVPYKRIDLALSAFKKIKKRLLIVGQGPELPYLRKLKSDNTLIIDDASDRDVEEYIRNCRALIFPGEEDFGIVPLEAQAAGKPVIAFGKGGALETVKGLNEKTKREGNATGILFFEQTPQAIIAAIDKFEINIRHFDKNICRENAFKFNKDVYKKAMKQYIHEVVKKNN